MTSCACCWRIYGAITMATSAKSLASRRHGLAVVSWGVLRACGPQQPSRAAASIAQSTDASQAVPGVARESFAIWGLGGGQAGIGIAGDVPMCVLVEP